MLCYVVLTAALHPLLSLTLSRVNTPACTPFCLRLDSTCPHPDPLNLPSLTPCPPPSTCSHHYYNCVYHPHPLPTPFEFRIVPMPNHASPSCVLLLPCHHPINLEVYLTLAPCLQPSKRSCGGALTSNRTSCRFQDRTSHRRLLA
jgi:hypothetical protein